MLVIYNLALVVPTAFIYQFLHNCSITNASVLCLFEVQQTFLKGLLPLGGSLFSGGQLLSGFNRSVRKVMLLWGGGVGHYFRL